MKKRLFKTLFNESKNEPFKLNAYFDSNWFSLTIIEKLNAWKALVKCDTVKVLSQQLDCPLDEYYDKLRNYLEDPTEDTVFSVDDDRFTVYHTIKSNNTEIKIKFFYCNIDKADYRKTVESLLDDFYINFEEIETKCETLQNENARQQKSESDLKNKLVEFVERKKAEDDDLYRNFVNVLNEKKKRIQHLNELLEAFKKGRNPSNPVVITKKFKRKQQENSKQRSKKIKTEAVSESESEKSGESADYDTDDEKGNVRPSKNGKIHSLKQIDSPMPSTSKICDINKNGSNLTVADSLLRDDSPPPSALDILNDSPPRQHILPKRLNKSKKNVDNPLIFKVTSSQSTATATRSEKKINTNLKKEEPPPAVDINTQDLLDML